MSDYTALIKDLSLYTRSKKGTVNGSLFRDGAPEYSLPHLEWGDFFSIPFHFDEEFADHDDDEDDDFLDEGDGFYVYATRRRLEEIQKQYPAIRKDEWLPRDGHIRIHSTRKFPSNL